jgi:hypothetical protein
MALGDGERLNRIEELKNKLYSKNYPNKVEHRDGFSRARKLDVPDSWQQEQVKPGYTEKVFMKTSVFKKFFFFSLGFFVLALGYASYMFFAGNNNVSNNNIDINVLGNTFTGGGEQLPLIISVTNRNSSALQLVDLVVEYPKGTSGASSSTPNTTNSPGSTTTTTTDTTNNTERLRESIGTINAGGTQSQSINPILFGTQGSVSTIKISIEYRVEGSNAIFVKEKDYDVTINSTPINLSINAPSKISPNQNITLNVKATLNATTTVPNMLLQVVYPVGFQFASAKPAPSFGNNVWNLGDLAPGSESDISITGKMIDVFDGEQKIFRVSSGSQSSTDKSEINTIFNSEIQTVAIIKPFVEAQLYINGVYQDNYATDSKNPIQGEIRWANNLDTKVDNLQIKATISGNAFDRATITAQQGFYNSGDNSITWDKSSVNNFAEVNPGDSGSVYFSVSPLSLFSGSGGMLSSPSISVNVSISGQQPQEGNLTTQINSSDSKTIQIITGAGFASKVLYYSGPFTNTGAIPPKVEKPTTYTVVWTLSNTSNNISKAQVTSTLPPWVGFVGKISPSTEDLTYDPSTESITWNVGNIPAGTGITTGTGKEVDFQITLNPSLSQVGTRPVLINNAILTGHDDFANVDVTVNKTSLDTDLTNDASFPAAGDRVVN